MKLFVIAFSLLSCACLYGCQTVHKGTKTAGEAVGKGADAIGGLSEGVAEGYKGADVTANNPYGR